MKKVLLSLLFIVSLTVFLSSCSKDDDEQQPVAVTYVLVHGAWQAPYVWDNVKATLEKNGDHVVVVELPAHGSDQSATNAYLGCVPRQSS